ncbi:MAG: sodium:proton antiporter [Clostridia bacterium]|nr:sodium:proton antiporter [Clostridia bacterium]
MITEAYRILYTSVLVILALLILFCLYRAVRGPRTADRIVSVNMISTMTIIMISVLSVMLKEGYLMDVALIYAMISFLAVVVLTRVYMGIRAEKEKKEEEEHRA